MSNVFVMDVRIVGVAIPSEREERLSAAAESLVRMIDFGDCPPDVAETGRLVSAIEAQRETLAHLRELPVDEFEVPAFLWPDRHR
jgi:hypothetical protein